MNLQPLFVISFVLCMICVVLGSALAISMIWMTYTSQFLSKSWSTIGVVFLASLVSLIVTKSFGLRRHPSP